MLAIVGEHIIVACRVRRINIVEPCDVAFEIARDHSAWGLFAIMDSQNPKDLTLYRTRAIIKQSLNAKSVSLLKRTRSVSPRLLCLTTATMIVLP
jgi:hypothetical protein